MGLDMYAYVGRPGQKDEYESQEGDWDPDTQEWVTKGSVTEPRRLAYWRKHPNLHGWMERLYRKRGGTDTFNHIELELCWDDIDNLEKTIRASQLPVTTGPYFGNISDTRYYEEDLKFCQDAKAELFLGLKVFYNSSW